MTQAISNYDLLAAASLVMLLAAMNWHSASKLGPSLLWSGIRMVLQLGIVGYVLQALFANVHLGWVALMAVVMLLAAGREVVARQKRRFAGLWGWRLGVLAMMVSSFGLTIFSMTALLEVQPWYQPRYAIPFLGMLLGNTMTGIAIGLDRLTDTTWRARREVEAQLLLGYSAKEAIKNIRNDATRAGLIPLVNIMSGAGIVSLPGMMTGQILAGNSPLLAIRYQILIMFLIAAGCGFATMLAVHLGSRRLFDQRERLRLDRLVDAQ